MMSRRKQSNPKPIKHDGDEDTSDKCDVGQAEKETDRNEHSPVNSETSPERHSGGIWSPESGDTLTDQGTCGYDNMEETEGQDGHSVTSEDLKPGTELSDTSPASDQRSSKSPDCARTSKCDSPEQSPDTGKEKDDVQSIVIKTEPPSSPSSVVNDNESRDAAYPPNISASFATLNGSRVQRRRRRSRSRSRSKSEGVPASPEATSTLTQTREEAERALVNRLQLPSDVLYFRQQEMNIHGTPSVSWVVCCAIPLPQGSSLGPFQGQLVPPESVKVGDLIVQFTNKKGQQALMNVAGQSGGWLALLRSAGTGVDRNTHVYWEGGRIWCEIISDIDIGTELRASFTFQNEDEGEDVDVEEDSLGSSIKEEVSGSEESSSNYSSLQQHSHQQTAAPGHAALIYGCPFCGVRFSSPRTLQGHLSFYCSKKTSEHSVTASPKVAEKKSNPGKTEDLVVKTEPDCSGDSVTSESKQDSGESETLKEDLQKDHSTPGQTFKCKYCSYRADKLSSLNRHMRMHNNDKNKSLAVIPNIRSTEKESKAKSDSKSLRIIKSPVLETFCKECRIQFSSLHTYKCHKEHYCAQRRKKALANPSAFEAMFHSPFSFAEAANVGIPSALQMAALNQGGLILPGAPGEANIPSGASVLVTAPMMTTNGMANITLSVPAMLVQPVVPGQDTRTSLTSPRVASTPEPKEALPSASHLSPRPQLLHFLSPPPPAFLKNDYSIRPEDLCRSMDSVTADNGTADIPLDLSVTKVKTESSNGGNKSEPKEIVSFLQPDKDGALDARSIKRFSSQSSTSPENKLKDLKDDSSSFNNRKSSLTTQRDESNDVKKESTTPQHFLRSDHLSPGASQLLPHPSLLASAAAAGFIPLPGITSLPISPKHPPPVASSSTTSISKCSDCNIVFYKYDNYLIHKKHYCSGKRRSVPAQASETLPAATDIPNQKDIHSKQSSPEIPTSNDAPGFQLTAKKSDMQASPSSSKGSTDVKYKYYCVPCRIKFSNASILEAHKEYYCPAGKDSEQSVILQSSFNESTSVDSPKDERSVSPEPLHEEFSCHRCNSVFSSARLLRLHVCEGGFPCPHCDQVSITDNRLAEHMKIHAPTKAYRCTICGYRGNTARGMRMHGKTHIDEGLDFTDENMLEYHEPALVPVVHSSHSGSTTDSELLRLKNEPYKRRRSRKAYEKFDYPLPKVDVPQTCLLCGQNFPNVDYLTSHFKVHEIASQYVAGLMKCLNCEYIGKDPDDLRSHFELNHLSGSRNKQRRLSTQSTEDDLSNLSKDRLMPQKLMVLSDPNSSDDERSSESYDFKFKTKVKSEPIEEAMEEGESNDRDNVLDENNVDEGMDLQPSSSISTIHIKQEEPDVDLEVDDEEREPGELVNSLRIKKEVLDEEETYCTSSNSNMGNNMECENVSAKENNVDSPKPESGVNLCGKSSSLKEDLLRARDEITRNKSPSPHSVVIKSERISPQSLSMTPNFLVNFSPNGTPASAGPTTQSSAGPTTQSSPLTFSPFDPPPSTSSAVSPFHHHPLAFPYSAPPHMALPYVFLQPHLSTSPLPLGLKPSGREERLGARYCQNCDISFSKPSTYLAHKKYYCTARPRGESQPSAKA